MKDRLLANASNKETKEGGGGIRSDLAYFVHI